MSHNYANPLLVTYGLGNQNFTSAVTQAVKPPVRRNRGRVFDIHVRVTTTFTAVTTPGYVNVGTAATAAKYAQLNMGTAASGSSYNFRDGIGTGTTGAVNACVFSDIDLNRDAVTAIQLQTVAPTGGTPAGAGYVDVIIGWN